MFLTVKVLRKLNLSKDWGPFRVTCQNTYSRSFKNLLSPISNYRLDIESVIFVSSSPLPHVKYGKTDPPEHNKPLHLTKQILIKTLLFSSNFFDIHRNTNILNATVNLIKDLLKDFTNGVFNEITDGYRNVCVNKKLIKSVSIWLGKRLALWIYQFTLYFLCS